MSDPTLITFPPSLDSEFSRFLLAHYGVRHREERHVMPLSLLFTLPRGSIRFPLLYGNGLRLNRVKEFVDHFEPLAPPERRLVPPELAAATRADWKIFHHEFNTPMTVWAYHHLLPHRDIMVEPLSRGTPRWEAKAVDRAYPLFQGLLLAMLRPTERRATAALGKIRGVLDRMDERLADGRRYLNGERYSLSDMAYAVAAAPVVWPDEYGGGIPALSDTPPALQAVVAETRARPAGELALRIYREHRAGPMS